MHASKWVPLTLGITLPAIYFAVKWSRPDAPAVTSSPVAVAPAVTVKEEASAVPEGPSIVTHAFGSGKDLRKVIYRMGKTGSPLTCDIQDDQGNRVLKCRYGYHSKPGPSYGELAEVQMFDTRSDQKESPMVRRIVRVGDKELAPITINVVPNVVDGILGTALAGFNPMTDWNLVTSPTAPR
jgi:hypothetical protein